MQDRTVPCHRPKEKVEREKREEEKKNSAEEKTLQKKFKETGLSWVAFVGKLNLDYWVILLIHAFISETHVYLVYEVLKEAVL